MRDVYAKRVVDQLLCEKSIDICRCLCFITFCLKLCYYFPMQKNYFSTQKVKCIL